MRRSLATTIIIIIANDFPNNFISAININIRSLQPLIRRCGGVGRRYSYSSSVLRTAFPIEHQHQHRCQHHSQIRQKWCASSSSAFFVPFAKFSFNNVAQQSGRSSSNSSTSLNIIGNNNNNNMSTAAATTAPPSASKDEEATIAIALLRKQKQSLRKQIRSRIKTAYPAAETDDAPDKLIDRSNKVFSRLFALPEYAAATSVGFFLSMPAGEIQTREAIERIVGADGKRLFVPRVGLDFERCDMDLIRCDTTSAATDDDDDDDGRDRDRDGMMLFYDSWPRNKWGIPEPPVSANEENVARPGDIDLLITPGLAFDTHGHRLGQGKGYYDRFIAKMRSSTDENDDNADDGGDSERKKKPILVGVCLEEQFLEEVPHGVDLGERKDGKGGIIPVSDHDYIMDMVLTPSRSLVIPKS